MTQAEIIIVESGTTAPQGIERAPVKRYRLKERLFAGQARNLAIERSTGEILFFLDDDCIAPRDWISLALRILDEHPGVDGLGGPIANGNPDNLPGTLLHYLEFIYHLPGSAGPPSSNFFFPGCNCVFRRNVFESARFPEREFSEDVVFSRKLTLAGKRLRFEPALLMIHSRRRTWKELAQKLWALGQSSAAYHRDLDLARGNFFLKFPPAIFCTTPWALCLLLRSAMRTHEPGRFFEVIKLLPLLTIAHVTWCLGFANGAFRRE